jgi:hypothetical protein
MVARSHGMVRDPVGVPGAASTGCGPADPEGRAAVDCRRQAPYRVGRRGVFVLAHIPPLLPFQPDVRLWIQVVHLKPRRLSARAPIREGEWCYWRLPPGRYLLIGSRYRPGDEPVVGPQPLTTCLPEGVHHGAVYGLPTLAVFDVPESTEAISLGTLKVEVTVRVLLDLSIDEFATDICVRSVGIFDEIEAQTKDLHDTYPGTRMAPEPRLMITGLYLPTAQDTDLESRVNEVLRSRSAP